MTRFKTATFVILFLGILCASRNAPGQIDPPLDKQPPTGIEWLMQFEGRWATAHDGTMISRIVGKRWLVSEIAFQQGPFSVQTLGYDDKKKQFVGTWVDATSSHIWRYTGQLNRDRKILTLATTGPDLSNPDKMRQYRDIYEFKSSDEIALETHIRQDNGEWKVFNKSTMTRKAPTK